MSGIKEYNLYLVRIIQRSSTRRRKLRRDASPHALSPESFPSPPNRIPPRTPHIPVPTPEKAICTPRPLIPAPPRAPHRGSGGFDPSRAYTVLRNRRSLDE